MPFSSFLSCARFSSLLSKESVCATLSHLAGPHRGVSRLEKRLDRQASTYTYNYVNSRKGCQGVFMHIGPEKMIHFSFFIYIAQLLASFKVSIYNSVFVYLVFFLSSNFISPLGRNLRDAAHRRRYQRRTMGEEQKEAVAAAFRAAANAPRPLFHWIGHGTRRPLSGTMRIAAPYMTGQTTANCNACRERRMKRSEGTSSSLNLLRFVVL